MWNLRRDVHNMAPNVKAFIHDRRFNGVHPLKSESSCLVTKVVQININ